MRTLTCTRLALAFVICIAVLPSRVLYAGGWATFTLDHVPDSPRAGEQIDLSFVARGHGDFPFDLPAGDATFVFTNRTTGESLSASAAPSGLAIGHHKAAVVLPSAGTWDWELHPSPYPVVRFQPLIVLAGKVDIPALALTPIVVITAGVLPAAVAATLLPQLGGELWKGSVIQLAPAPKQSNAARGKALFVAKGCVTCHYHGELQGSNSIGIGPDLTRYPVSVEYLHLWLANPAAVKPLTKMPDLGLQTDEIDALAAFLTKQ